MTGKKRKSTREADGCCAAPIESLTWEIRGWISSGGRSPDNPKNPME